MDEYKRVAGLYFNAVEGRHLYPGFGTWHWYAFAVTLLSMLAYLVHLFHELSAHRGNGSTVTILVLDVILVGVWMAISSHKEKAMLAAASLQGEEEIQTADDCRRSHLSRLCGVPRDKFFKVVKECSDLIDLQKSHRLVPELGFDFYARKVYDPDSKARLLTILMGAIALFSALMVRSLPEGSPSVLELIADGGVWELVGTLVFVAIMFFGIALGLHAATVSIKSLLGLWWTKLTGRAANGEVALRYFMRDLVRLHAPIAFLAGAASDTHQPNDSSSLPAPPDAAATQPS